VIPHRHGRGATSRDREICENIREHVYQVLDGRLTAARRREVETHLRKCPPCFSKLEMERIMRRLVRETVTAEPCPKRLWDRVRAAIACECVKRSPAPRRRPAGA
jgi:mycothiol system anti-sigma-R factor